jgi:hypothetical protein
MESRPPSIPHPPFPRPSLFSTAPQHSRQYGSQQVSRTDARAHASYDGLHRQDGEPSRTASAYGYSSQSYNPDLRSQTRSTSPTRFSAMHSEAAKRSALGSPVKHNGILGKEGVFYREGRNFLFLFHSFHSFFVSFCFFLWIWLALPACRHSLFVNACFGHATYFSVRGCDRRSVWQAVYLCYANCVTGSEDSRRFYVIASNA